MIYINNNYDNTINTEVWSTTTPASIIVYFNNKLFGIFNNDSINKNYIKFIIPKGYIEQQKIENMEYEMHLFNNNYALIKTETVSVIGNKYPNIISLDNEVLITSYKSDVTSISNNIEIEVKQYISEVIDVQHDVEMSINQFEQ